MKEMLRGFIEDNLLVGESRAIGDEDELLLDGILDSLGITRLIGFIGSELDVDVPANDATIDNFRTLSHLTAYLEEKKSGVDRAT